MSIRRRFPAIRQLRRDGAPVSELARPKRLRHAGSETGIPVGHQSNILKTRVFPASFSPVRATRPACRSTPSRPAWHFELKGGEDARGPTASDKVGDKDSNLKL